MFVIGGPHRGVAMVPNCESGYYCDMLTYLIDNAVYFNTTQQLINPASYWREPMMLDTFLKDSVFLPLLNNERDFDQKKKDRILALNHAFFVMNNEDTVVYPKETAVFGEL
jgi:palmitoyl-protein thioesterase